MIRLWNRFVRLPEDRLYTYFTGTKFISTSIKIDRIPSILTGFVFNDLQCEVSPLRQTLLQINKEQSSTNQNYKDIFSFNTESFVEVNLKRAAAVSLCEAPSRGSASHSAGGRT